jgi:hypothetical protein
MSTVYTASPLPTVTFASLLASTVQRPQMERESFQKHIDELKKANKVFSEGEELKYFNILKKDIELQSSIEIKEFMLDMLEYYLRETSMNLKYFYEEIWHSCIGQAKKDLETLHSREVYVLLENILARQSDSKEYTKYHDTKRYPLWAPRAYSNEIDKINNITSDLSRLRIIKSYYKFGSHQYHVGQAINKVLSALEERYDLNFKELERMRQIKSDSNT